MKNINNILALLTVIAIASCGGGGGSDNPPPQSNPNTLTGVVAKGPVGSAEVLVFRAGDYSSPSDDAKALNAGKPAITDGTGHYSASFNYSGPVVIVARPKTGSTMVNELGGGSLPYSFRMRAALPSVGAHTTAHVTPFTEMSAKVVGSSTSAAAIDTANWAIRTKVLPGLDPLTTSPVVDSRTTSLEQATQKQMVVALAAVAQVGNSTITNTAHTACNSLAVGATRIECAVDALSNTASALTSSGVSLDGSKVAFLNTAMASLPATVNVPTVDASGNLSSSGTLNTVTDPSAIIVKDGVAANSTLLGTSPTPVPVTPPAVTYSISGTVTTVAGTPLSGVQIALTGTATNFFTTPANGSYSFTGLAGGNYTVTPLLNGYNFSGPISITALAADSTGNNFVATPIPQTHNISGTITLNGAGMTGVTITVIGALGTNVPPVYSQSDANGNYTVTGLIDGDYKVMPSISGYVFTPLDRNVTVAGHDVTTGADFTASVPPCPTCVVSGMVSGPWVEGVNITLRDVNNANAIAATCTTGPRDLFDNGNYTCPAVPQGAYTVTPSLAGYNYKTPSGVAADSGIQVPVGGPTNQDFVASSTFLSRSISGTVSYVGTNTGVIGILAYDSATCSLVVCNGSPMGTVINASGDVFTISGLDNRSYVLVAEMDAQHSGRANANNPIGTLSIPTGTANVSGVTIPIVDRTATVVAPTIQSVATATAAVNGSAFILYQAPQNGANEEIATSYKLYWGTDPFASNSGTFKKFNAQGGNATFVAKGSLIPRDKLYFKLSALVGTVEAFSAPFGPVTIGAANPGTNTVSGAVSFPVTATGPLYVGVYDGTNAYFSRHGTPISPQNYSISGLPDGTYQTFAFLDQDGDGVISAGDISDVSDTSQFSVNGGSVSGKDIVLSTAGTSIKIMTDHQWDGGTNHSYMINLNVNELAKRPVAMTLMSGPNVALPADIFVSQNNWPQLRLVNNSVPQVNDTYLFKVFYSDGSFSNGTTEPYLTSTVTAVMSNFAQNLAMSASGTPGQPLFTWAAPTPTLVFYTYRLQMSSCCGTPPSGFGSANWNYPRNIGLPSNTFPLQFQYNLDGTASPPTLTSGLNYYWQIRVEDANRNSATRRTFTMAP